MRPDLALQLVSDVFWSAFVVCMPVFCVTMAVGVVISIMQVVTQVQEMSLTFVPKLLAAGVTLTIFGAWMLKRIMQFTIHLWAHIPAMF